MSQLQVVFRSPKELRPAKANARTHSPKQIAQIGRSIRSFGFNNPVLLDRNDEIIAGHGRVAAAIEIGLQTVPTLRLEHLTEAQKRAYVIADNKLAELAGWDKEILAIELGELLTLDLDFEISDIGFEMPEIDLMVAEKRDADEPDPADEIDALDDVPSVARSGDLWMLGEHLLFCGDALDASSYRVLLGQERAQMIFTDPPYNVPIAGHVSGKGRAKHREFVMASGEMTPPEFTQFLRNSFDRLIEVSVDGAIHFICMDWAHLRELLQAGLAYSELKNLCVWVKTNGGMGSLYRSQHELVGVFKSGRGKHINNVDLGRHGRNRTNVWTYAGMNAFQRGRDDALAMHPTVKPVDLIADAIYDCSTRGGIVLDPFGGSGTTIIAAERTGRRARVMEMDPRYVDVALHRFAKLTGQSPVNIATGSKVIAA